MRMSTLFRYSYPLHVFHEITSMNFNDTYETSFYLTSKAGQITKKGPFIKKKRNGFGQTCKLYFETILLCVLCEFCFAFEYFS